MEIIENKKTLTFVKTTNKIKEENQYFWSSRSMYAVEFITTEQDTKQIKFIEVQFVNDIILCKRFNYSDKCPFNTSKVRDQFVTEIITALVRPGYMDSRTKEQFYDDFDSTLNNIQNYRK